MGRSFLVFVLVTVSGLGQGFPGVEFSETAIPPRAGQWSKWDGSTLVVLQAANQAEAVRYQFGRQNDDHLRLREVDVVRYTGSPPVIQATNLTMLDGSSHKEFALSLRPLGETNSLKWMGSHGADTNVVQGPATIYREGIPLTWADSSFVKGEVLVVGDYVGYWASDLTPGQELADLNVRHLLRNGEGCVVTTRLEWLRNTEVDIGYVGMCPLIDPDRVGAVVGMSTATANNNVSSDLAADDNSQVNFGDEEAHSFFALSADNRWSLVFEAIGPGSTLRVGAIDRRPANVAWIQRRTDGIDKIYFTPYWDSITTALDGDLIHFGIRYLPSMR